MRNGEAGWRSLDTLKGIAIFSVVFFHVKGSFPGAFPNALGFFYQWGGYLGNYLFFMISGLCISWGYRDKIAGGEVGFFAFMKRRLAKLYPLYFVTELICLFFLARQPGSGSLRPREILRNLLCINYGWFENSLPYNFPCWFLRACLKFFDKREGKADNKGKQAGDEGECDNIQAISAGKSMRRYERI